MGGSNRLTRSELLALLRGHRGLSENLSEDLAAHLEIEIQENLQRGMVPEEARAAALRHFGNRTLIQESAREAWDFTAIENLAKDLLYAGRMARKGPGFAITAILTLALGIGGTAAMFTVIRGVLLKPLDYPDADRIVRIRVGRWDGPGGPFNLILYRELQRAAGFSAFGALGIPEIATISSGGPPESVKEAHVSANFLAILGVNPLLGRGFSPSDDWPGGPDVVLLSYRLWQRRFGGNPNITGRSISLNARDYTVTGVLPPHFDYPWFDYDVWVTRPWEWSELTPELWEGNPHMSGLARLKPGVTLERARAQLNVIARRYALAHPGMASAEPNVSMAVERLEDNLVRNVRTLLWMLFAAVGFVLLIVCANIAGLLLARSAGRSREFAVRSALGAARSRLMQQLLAESLALSLAGAVLGFLLAYGVLTAMTHIGSLDLPRADDIHMDGVVLAFTAALSATAGLLFGWLPSLRFSRPDLADFLREQGALAGRASAGRSAFGLRGILVAAQVALSTMLLLGASLMLESFVRLRNVDPGFQPARLLTMQIALPTTRYDTDQKRQAFWDELLQRTERLPGVADAAVTGTVPTALPYEMVTDAADRPRNNIYDRPVVNIQIVTPEYFRTLGIPLLRGRGFAAQDRAGAPRVTIINETAARFFWPSYPQGKSPLGQHLLGGTRNTALEIVGIAGDVHEDALSTEVKPEVYFPLAQRPPQNAYLSLKVVGEPEDLVRAVRGRVMAMDSRQSLSDIQTMTQRLSASLGRPRLTTVLLASFAAVAFVLALMGIYGVIAFLVVERTQEFGIRQALGAQRGDILKLVLGRGIRLVLTGLASGIIGAAALARIMKATLFHVNPTDPWTFVGVSALFLAVGLAACYVPARRATRMDPAATLR